MRKLNCLFMVIAVSLLAAAPFAAAQTASLTILHTNDTHGHMLPFSYPDSAASGRALQGLRVYNDLGGTAARATPRKRTRQGPAPRAGTPGRPAAGGAPDDQAAPAPPLPPASLSLPTAWSTSSDTRLREA